jgi:hypothetical protein
MIAGLVAYQVWLCNAKVSTSIVPRVSFDKNDSLAHELAKRARGMRE